MTLTAPVGHSMPETVSEAAAGVLTTADPREKAARARQLARAFAGGELALAGPATGATTPPDRPARPDRPELKRPGEVPRRRITADPRGRIALLHALAHIELNAIDLAFDIVARFVSGRADEAAEFAADWISVGDDEARHFLMLADRLEALGAAYGDLPAHDGLWQASQDTAHDLLARLAIVPLVLEARGLDVTPAMIGKLTRAGDSDSAACLQIIHDDEIGHVATGKKWFDRLCAERGLPPRDTWRSLVARHFKGVLKEPFNVESRNAANFPEDYYRDMPAGV